MGLDFELEKIFGAKVFTNEPMRKHTSFKLGGYARYFIKADYLITIKRVIELLSSYNVPYKFIGNGSNLLVSDSGFNGAIINPCFNNISLDNNLVVATSAVNLTTFSKYCEYHGFSGLEELSGIPGTVGGAITMNASAFGVAISDYLEEVTILYDGKIQNLYKEDCRFSYRESLFKGKKFFIVNGKFSFKKNNCALLDSVKKGQRVKVRFTVDGRRWDGPKGVQYFVDLTGFKIEVVDSDGSSKEPIAVPEAPDFPEDVGDVDDMPF
jgi:UDP-N-acetylmuramate dehydrogenase